MDNFRFFRGFTNVLDIEVVHGVRRLTPTWSPELEHLSVEDDLIRLMSEEISRSIDADIVNQLSSETLNTMRYDGVRTWEGLRA